MNSPYKSIRKTLGTHGREGLPLFKRALNKTDIKIKFWKRENDIFRLLFDDT